jgi:hypothetical protein
MSLISFAPTTHTHNKSLIIERFLRDRDAIWQQIGQDTQLDALIRQMLVSSAVALAGYGAVIGLSQGPLQALASALKLPILFLLTLLVCLPALYIYNLLCGGRLSARQALALTLAAVTVTAIFTLAFAPITLFFLITAPHYQFFILLNVAILSLTGGVGLFFLVDGARRLNRLVGIDQTVEEAGGESLRLPRMVSMGLLPAWLLLYGFVGAQLGWTLRPFFGMPGESFALFRAVEGNFYGSVIEMILWLLR